MLNVTVFVYEAFGSLFAIIVPLILIMTLFFVVAKIGKGFYKSLTK